MNIRQSVILLPFAKCQSYFPLQLSRDSINSGFMCAIFGSIQGNWLFNHFNAQSTHEIFRDGHYTIEVIKFRLIELSFFLCTHN